MGLSVLFTEAPDADATIIGEVAGAEEARVERVARDRLPAAMLAALAAGGVVYVAVDGRDASWALGLGADEVVRIGHLTRKNLARALERAALRAKARAAHARLSERPEDTGRVLSLLTAAVGHEMNTPLAVALLTCDALSEGLPLMLDMQERLIGWAALAAPQPEVRDLRSSLARQPSPSEVRAMLVDLRDGIGRAAQVARLVRRLSQDQFSGSTSAAETIADVNELLRGPLGDSEVRVEVRGRCVVRVRRATLVLLLAGLLAHAVEALRAGASGKPWLEITASEQEDAVLIEIAHNGAPISADLRPGVLEPYFALSSRGASDHTIEGLQARARSLGGELLILLEECRTTLRLVLPGLPAETEASAPLPGPAPEAGRRRSD